MHLNHCFRRGKKILFRIGGQWHTQNLDDKDKQKKKNLKEYSCPHSPDKDLMMAVIPNDNEI